MRCVWLIFWMLIGTLKTFGQESDMLQRAQYLYDEGKYMESISVLNQLIDIEEDNFGAHLLRGNCFQKEEKFVAAIQDYEKAEELDKNSAILSANHGAAFINLNQLSEAEKKLKKALKIDPLLPEANYFMGNIYYFDFKLSAAIKHYDQAIEKRPSYREALFMRAAAHAEMENYSAALRDYEKVTELDPDLAVAKFNIAVIRLQNEEYDKAQEILSEVSPEALPKPVDYFFYQAEALYFSGQKDKACEIYEKAMNMGDTEAGDIYRRYCISKEERPPEPQKRTIRMAF